MLREDADGYWLAGMIFADGAGLACDFEAWGAELAARLSDPFASGNDCAHAWGVCKQADRRAVLATRLASAREGLHWLEGTWHAHWCDLANLEVTPAPALLALEAPIDSGCAVARSRVLFGGASSWPDGGELAMLRIWPATRAMTAVRLQAAISLGARPAEIVAMLPTLLTQVVRSWSGEDLALVEDFGQDFARDFGRDFGRGFVWDFARYFVRYFGRYFVRYFGRYFGRYFDREFGRDLGRDLDRDLGRDFVGEFVRQFVRARDQYFVRDFGRYFVRDFGRDFGRGFVRDFARDFVRSTLLPEQPWLSTFAFLEASSVAGRAGPRAALAHGEVPDGTPLRALFRAACQASFAPGDARLCTAAAVTPCGRRWRATSPGSRPRRIARSSKASLATPNSASLRSRGGSSTMYAAIWCLTMIRSSRSTRCAPRPIWHRRRCWSPCPTSSRSRSMTRQREPRADHRRFPARPGRDREHRGAAYV